MRATYNSSRIQRRTARNLTERRMGPKAAVDENGAIGIGFARDEDGTLLMRRAVIVAIAGRSAGGRDPGDMGSE